MQVFFDMHTAPALAFPPPAAVIVSVFDVMEAVDLSG